jgi:D-cysteine desulfhydrase
LTRLESYLHRPDIWIKRDDQTSPVFGGAKARELEFVFGDILRRGCGSVMAFGSIASNHALATAAFARHFRVRAILALHGRRASPRAERILRLEHDLGAELHRLDGSPAGLLRLLRSFLADSRNADSRLPYVIWPRRAALLGALGFVNAALELRRQINTGVLARPRTIYLPAGSGAALAGLALGCELAEIDADIVGVAGPESRCGSPRRLAAAATRALRQRSRRVRLPHLRLARLSLRKDTERASTAAQQAQSLSRDLENLDLDAAFGARAMAALVADCRSGAASGPVLFWHTSAANLFASHPRATTDALPREFREFFVAP